MPKAIKKKIEKKTKPEEPITTIQQTLRRRQKTLVTATVALLLAAAIVGGGALYIRGMAKKAAELNFKGYSLFYSPSTATEPVAAQPDRLNQALESFQKAYAAKKSPYSLYYAGAVQYELGKYEDAIKTLQELERRYPQNNEYLPLGYLKTAMAYLKLGKKEEALGALDRLDRQAGALYKDLALYESGRLLESMGKKEEAKEKYERLKKEYPESPYATDLTPPAPARKK